MVLSLEHQRLQGICCCFLLSSMVSSNFKFIQNISKEKHNRMLFNISMITWRWIATWSDPQIYFAAKSLRYYLHHLAAVGTQAMVALRVHGSAMQYLQKPMSEEGVTFFIQKSPFFSLRGQILCSLWIKESGWNDIWNTFSGTIP